MSKNETPNPILIGSIIHLGNMLKAGRKSVDGGYLNILKRLEDEPIISMWPDPNVRALVATHVREHGSKGSGSWQVISADGMKRTGDQLAVGDKIHLLNMQPEAGYLDSFEWVDRFKSVDNAKTFKDYPMQTGVFTSDSNRGRSISGTWTIKSVGNEPGTPVEDGDIIELENDYPGVGKLHTYGEVAENASFKKYTHMYNGQCLFVFTGPQPDAGTDVFKLVGSPKWKVTLDDRTTHLYRVYNWRGERKTPLHDGGIFKIVDRLNKRVISLSISSNDQGETLSGKVTYQGDDSPGSDNFIANHLGQNDYKVKIDNKELLEVWQLGTREFQRVVAMNIRSDEDTSTLQGQMTYAGEGPIGFVGTRGIVKPNEISQLLHDVPQPGWVRGRTNRVESAIAENHNLLANYFASITRISIDSVGTHSLLFATKSDPNDTATTKSVNIPAAFDLSFDPSFDPLDREFQIEQLLNLNSLSQLLNGFFRYTLHALMAQSLEKHRQDNDGTVAPLHLFRQCFQHVAMDHGIIQKAIVQRQWDLSSNSISMGKYAMELLILDKLAIKAITPFRALLLGDTNTGDTNTRDTLAVITYLSEETHIHLVPYTKQFILIGVSYDRVPLAASIFDGKKFLGKDFYAYEVMAIPHEVAHYMYQHGTLDGKTFPELSRQFENNPYYIWCEEIFADVYSCIVAGPLAAISMQALLMSIDRDRAWKDDEEHPTPVLRVFIFAEILRVLSEIKPELYKFTTAADGSTNGTGEPNNVTDQLDQEWAEILRLWRYDHVGNNEDYVDRPYRPVRVYMHDNSALHLDTIVNVNRVMKAIRPIIEEFATCLLEKAEFGDTGTQDTGTQNNNRPLSMKIPWTDKNYTTTEPYNKVMTSMTDRDFAQQKVASQLIVNPNVDAVHFDLSNPDDKLQHYLKAWSDSGPISGGGSGGTKGPLFQQFF